MLYKFLKDLNQSKMFLLMLLPGTLLLFLFNYLPMAGIIIAFKSIHFSQSFFDSIVNSKWVGFKNFEFFIKTPDAFNITKNTVVYNSIFIVLGVIVPVSCAIALNEIRSQKLSKLFQSVMFLPYFFSWVVVSYLVYAFLNADHGVMNNVFLKPFGITKYNWYASTHSWPYIFVILHLWKYTGYSTVLYLAAIVGIDSALYEAAVVDGATKWKQIRHITIPSLIPLMTILTILAVGRIFNADFGLFYQVTLNLGNGILKPVGDVIDTYVYSALINSGDLGMASAANFYQSIVGFAIVMAANFIVRIIDSDNVLF